MSIWIIIASDSFQHSFNTAQSRELSLKKGSRGDFHFYISKSELYFTISYLWINKIGN